VLANDELGLKVVRPQLAYTEASFATIFDDIPGSRGTITTARANRCAALERDADAYRAYVRKDRRCCRCC
jgi:hypothetical protein